MAFKIKGSELSLRKWHLSKDLKEVRPCGWAPVARAHGEGRASAESLRQKPVCNAGGRPRLGRLRTGSKGGRGKVARALGRVGGRRLAHHQGPQLTVKTHFK